MNIKHIKKIFPQRRTEARLCGLKFSPGFRLPANEPAGQSAMQPRPEFKFIRRGAFIRDLQASLAGW